MKTLINLSFIAISCLLFSQAWAQKETNNVNSFFNNAPARFELSTKNLENLMALTPGNTSIITLDNNFSQKGTVLSNTMKYENLQSVLIKFEALDNTLLQVSKITLADHSYKYVGRIMNNNAADAYELISEKSEKYAFKKVEMKNVLQDCSYQ